MRKIVFGVANSLDNYIARSDHGIDWILWDEEAQAAMGAFWTSIDTIVMGRKTYEQSLILGSVGGGDSGITNYVFSRTLSEIEHEDFTLIDGNPVEFVNDLKVADGKDVFVMGGGDFAKTMLEAGVVDQLDVCIHPILLGSGIPLFHEMESQINLERISCEPFANGCVYIKYRVIP